MIAGPSKIKRLPDAVTVQYSELLQNCIQPLSDGSNISFKAKSVNGKRYWYLYISLGTSRREHYLGEESVELLDRIADERAAWESSRDDRDLRARLVRMLTAGGMAATSVSDGKILALLERSGLFLAGGVVVGTVAFRAYANMLGVQWPEAQRTQDLDIAADNRAGVVLPRARKPVPLASIIKESGLGFFEVPALDRKRPSTSFKIRGRDFRVDVLTPMRGRDTERPIHIEAFDTWAQPVRFLDYLLDDIQPAVLLYQHGIMVNVPTPGRFAIHKCALSQMRPASEAVKSRKDLLQAEQIFPVLCEDRPVDLQIAYAAAASMGKQFSTSFRGGFSRLNESLRDTVAAVIDIA